MTRELKYADPDKVYAETEAHIAKCGAMCKLAEAMREFMQELNRRPTKPTVRLKRMLETFLLDVTGVIQIGYTHSTDFQGKSRVRFTFRGYVDEEVSYELSYSHGYVIDINYSMIGHCLWGTHGRLLGEKLPYLRKACKTYNDALYTLQQVSQFAKPDDSLHAIYPLSEAFSWYELCHLKSISKP